MQTIRMPGNTNGNSNDRPVPDRPIYWLVDLENTGSRWTGAASLFRPGDTVVFFWSGKSCDVSMKSLPDAPWLRYMFVQCSNGTMNALDFQLCAWLGRMSAQEPRASFAILSFDQGYRPLEQFMDHCFGTRVVLASPVCQDENISNRDPEDLSEAWSSQQNNGLCMPAPSPAPNNNLHMPVPSPAPNNNLCMPAPSPVPSEDPIRAIYRKKLTDAGLTNPDDLRILSAILMQSMRLAPNMRKLNARNRLASRYGAKDGNQRYNAVKSVIRDIANNGPYPDTEISYREPVPNNINKALGQAGVALKSGMVAKACNAVVIAQACAGQEAREDSLRKSIARIFPAGQNRNAWAVLSPYLKAKL